MTRPIAALLAVSLAVACRSIPEPTITPTSESVIGAYGLVRESSSSFLSGTFWTKLRLEPDGRYQVGTDGHVTSSIGSTPDEGDGGRWWIDDDVIRFEPDDEPLGASVSFGGAFAHLTQDGLLLFSGRDRYSFFGIDQEEWSTWPLVADDSFLESSFVPVEPSLLTSLTMKESRWTMSGSSEGTFVAGVWPYSVDGCLTVLGNGIARGRYTREGDVFRFEVEKASGGIAFDIDDATARREGSDLILRTADGSTYRLAPGRNLSTELSEE